MALLEIHFGEVPDVDEVADAVVEGDVEDFDLHEFDLVVRRVRVRVLDPVDLFSLGLLLQAQLNDLGQAQVALLEALRSGQLAIHAELLRVVVKDFHLKRVILRAQRFGRLVNLERLVLGESAIRLMSLAAKDALAEELAHLLVGVDWLHLHIRELLRADEDAVGNDVEQLRQLALLLL